MKKSAGLRPAGAASIGKEIRDEQQAREELRIAHTAYMRQWRILRRQAGLCTQCGHPLSAKPCVSISIHPEKESEKVEA